MARVRKRSDRPVCCKGRDTCEHSRWPQPRGLLAGGKAWCFGPGGEIPTLGAPRVGLEAILGCPVVSGRRPGGMASFGCRPGGQPCPAPLEYTVWRRERAVSAPLSRVEIVRGRVELAIIVIGWSCGGDAGRTLGLPRFPPFLSVALSGSWRFATWPLVSSSKTRPSNALPGTR